MVDDTEAHAAIDALIAQFYAAFGNADGATAQPERLHALCWPQARIAKIGADAPTIDDLSAFIAPRAAWLADGTLRDFREWETHAHTEILGALAQRSSRYEKQGWLRGEPYAGRGRKLFQLLRGPEGWRILSVAWQDD